MENGCLGGAASGGRDAYGGKSAWAFFVCVGAAVAAPSEGVDRERDGNGIGHDARERVEGGDG